MKLIFSILILFLSLNSISQTTFPWSGTYGGTGTNRTYTTTVGGITMSATMVNSENVWQDASPKWFPTGSTNPGGGCSGITATNQGMLLSTDWTTNATKTITTTITFSSPVQGPVNFKLYDINDDGFGSWEDKMIISGTNSAAVPVNVFKVGTACVQTGGSVTGSGTPTLTFNSGQSTSCTCWGNNEINVGTATDCISTITIQYKSNVNPTNYNNPKQYVVISNLTAIIPIATAPTSITGTQSICAGQSTTLTAVGGNATTQWYTGSCGGTLVGTGASITVTPGTTTTYYVRNGATACVPASSCIPVTVTVNPSPTMTSVNSGSICSGSPLNFALTSDFGTSYSWVAANNPNTSGESTTAQSGATINNTITNNVATAQNVVYTVTPSASGCPGTPQTVTITVNPATIPTFTAVAPICTGGALAALPTTSNNGINGTWSPAINNTATTLYTFTPTAGQCATTATMTITVNSSVTPTFTAVAPICVGDPLAALPTTSNNGINGTWSPAINNTATTLYTFTPTAGQCATTTTMTISVGPPATPTFTAITPICSGDPLAALPTTSNNGFNGTWSPAINNTTTTLYTFTPAAGQCATTTTLTITVNANVTPTFTAVAPICSGDPLALPTTTNNGINGTWSPAINNTATTLYTFTPTAGQCATTTTMTISVTPPTIPTFTAVAPICNGDPLTALPTTSNNGFSGTWSPAVNNTATTLYTFTPTAGQCATTTTMTITVNSSVTPTFTAVAPICTGDPLAALPTTSNNGFTGTWSPALNNTATTLYTFTPAAGQCATSTTMTITVNSNVTPTFNAVAPICSGATLAALPTTSNNGINGTWSPALNNTATTLYTFTPTAGQCATSATLTITVNSNVTPTFTAVAPICSSDPIAALPTTSNNGINGTWSPAINNAATTLYTFTPTAGQCATTATLTITVNANVTPTFTAVAPVCTGDPIAALPTTSNNGINGTWSPAINNTATTLYTFTPTAGQCATTTTMTISVGPPATPTFTAITPICSGDPLAALPTTSNNGFTGTWSPALNNTATTLYTFTPSAGQCVTSTTMTITVNSNVTPTFTAVAPICSGDPLAALPTTSNNGINGTWSPAINNTATTLYTFTPTAGQCATTATMTITVNSNVTPTFTVVAPICTGDALAALPTTSNNGINGTWSPAINNTATTLYTFTPTAGQCATTATMTISVGPPATPTFTALTPICSGDALSALPTTSNNGFTGTWSPAINNTATTLYTYTPSAGQCATSTTMTITVNSNVTPTFTAVAPICSGDPLATLPTTSNNGINGTWSPAINNTATTLYTFTPTTGQCATSTTMTITVNSSVTPTFTAVAPICTGDPLAALPITSINGINGTWSPAINNTATTLYTFTPTAGQCATSTTLTITVNSSVTPTFTAVASICSGDPLTALPTASTNGINGTWSPALNNTATTFYTFTPTAGQCATTATMTITVNPLPVIDAGLDQTICVGSSVTLSGSGASTYSWNNGISNGVAFQPISTATYTVTGTTINGCENSDDVTIIVNQTLPVSFTADITNGCAPLTVTLTNTTANSSDCNWIFSNGTAMGGCGSITTTFTQEGCYDVTLNTLFANGCTGSQTLTNLICVENAPNASFNQSTNTVSEFDPFIDFTNTSTGASSYLWDFGDNSAPSSEENPTHDYTNSNEGLFPVMLIAYSPSGCSDTAYSNFQFNDELIFYVPNTFTPDGDIFNQEFLPIFSSGYDPFNYNLVIFNRWGELIFESNNPEIGWDGSYEINGEILMCQDGTYTWKITYKTVRNDERKFAVGHVNLIR